MIPQLRRHRALLLAVLTIVVVAAVYWQTFSRMVAMWSLLNYEHCWLVPPISLYVLWRKRHVLAQADMQASVPGALATALVVLVWIVSRSIGVQVVEFTAATLLIFTAFWAVAGNRATEKAAFPLLLLVAAVPAGEVLVEPLMNLTASVAGALLNLSGAPVVRDGTFLTLPGGSFEVADVCSGLRFLLAGAMASLAYGYVTYTSLKKRVLFLVVTSAVLVLLNGVRAFIVMYVASATEMRVFGGQDHVYFGMALFALVFVALVYLGGRYADKGHDLRPARAPVSGKSPISGVAAGAALALILAGPLFQYAKAAESLPVAGRAGLPALPGCSGPAEWSREWSPEFSGADYIQRAAYRCGALDGSVYVAGYLRQAQGKELINSANRIWPKDWRRYVAENPASVSTDAGMVDVQEVRVRFPERSILIWYWYRTGDDLTGSPVKVKVLAAIHALALEPREASIEAVVLSTDRGTDPASLRETMESLARVVMSRDRESG